MQTAPVKSESWVCMGEDWLVTTTKMQGESQEAFCARHDKAVAFWQSVCPPE
jgi:hypothetical protein